MEVLNAVVRRLGGFIDAENIVSPCTTHLVAGEPARTLNMVRAIARGCWILRHEWLLRSAEVGYWLEEEDYEMSSWKAGIAKSRAERQAFGSKHRMSVLEGLKIYVIPDSNPACGDLQELIHLAGGTVVKAPRQSDVLLGEYRSIPNSEKSPVCLTERWLLESIMTYSRVPYRDYLIPSSQ